MGMAKELKNLFSWSKTRDEIFRECLRKYYFHYYGYWNGWRSDSDARTREIYILKKLMSRAAWAGIHVHDAIHRILTQCLKGEMTLGIDTVREELLQTMRKEFKASREGLYRRDPKAHRGLFEHEYNIPTEDAVWKETADKAVQGLNVFWKSDVFAQLKALPAGQWLEVEERSSFSLEGLQILLQLDCAFRRDDTICIYDWKTGGHREGMHNLQMGCYGLYAQAKWQCGLSQLNMAEFNLQSGQVHDYPLTEELLEEVKVHIHDSADEMLFPLDDPDANSACEENFDVVEEEAPCHRCNFLKVCPKWA